MIITQTHAAPARSVTRSFHQANQARAAATGEEAAEEARGAVALAAQARRFDFELEERSELQREAEALDTLFLAQLKHQDEILKAWLRLA